MNRLRIGIVALAFTVISTCWLIAADEKKPDEKKPDDPKPKGMLPQNWKLLGLTKDQVTDVYKVQTKYNAEIDKLRAHRNAHETHRELRMTAQSAWDRALAEKRSVLRPRPDCPWWPYVWSQRTSIKVGSDGRVPIGSERLRIEVPPGTKVLLCLHPTGHHSILSKEPAPETTPKLIFTNRPR